MTLLCPKCGKPAKTEPGLVKHLMGTVPYGGHAIPAAEAQIVAAGARTTPPPPPPVPLHVPPSALPLPATAQLTYLEEVFVRLVECKALPKYQFERRIDAFLVGFLPELLSQQFGGVVEPVAPEFPLKKPGSNASTNVDHVLYLRHEDPAQECWLFLELKTDDGSVNHKQIATYEHYVALGMQRLFDDVLKILAASTNSAGYAALLRRFEGFDTSRPVRVVYLSPTAVTGLPPTFEQLTFAQLSHLEVQRHTGAWDLFRRIVLPALATK